MSCPGCIIPAKAGSCTVPAPARSGSRVRSGMTALRPSTRASTAPSPTCAPASRRQLRDRPVERRDQPMLHLHRLERQQPLALGNRFARRNLDRRHPPRHRRDDLAVVHAVPADAAARGQLELVRLAFVEHDHPLVVAEARHRRHRLPSSSATLRNSPPRPSVDAGLRRRRSAGSRRGRRAARRPRQRRRDRRRAAPQRIVGLGRRAPARPDCAR